MSDQGKYSHEKYSHEKSFQEKDAHPGVDDRGDSHYDHESLDTQRLKHQGREAAHDVSNAAQQQAEYFYERQRELVADQAGRFTRVMKKAADEFEGQHQPFFSQQARRAAEFADDFSHQLRNKDLKRLCQDAQNYSRREPAVFIGGAIAAGFLVARFLRSSQRHHQDESSERHTQMNASGSYYASQHSPSHSSSSSTQHPASRHPSSFDNDEHRPGERDPTRPPRL
ncbi:hypothetical protein ACGK9R_02915 [Halomonas sp. HNIBRBA4712]|uniref:hypothetical protein n=1 Tax=Halomonas sp. HNIBRBA4712 TaxID=3373087 RepID=UPI003745825F